MIVNSTIFHIVEVEYVQSDELKVRMDIWNVLHAQAKGIWFEHHGEDSLKRVHSYFPDVASHSVWHPLNQSWTAYYCFREYEDAQFLMTYLKIMEEGK